MDIASTLIRSIVRAFYSPESVLVIDALMIHATLKDEDLAYLMNMQPKYLRKLCGKLREDGLVSVQVQQELRPGAQRPFNRDWYYINFHKAIDVIKFRVAKMGKEVKQRFTQTAEEKKDYHCPQCKSDYTQMDVLDSYGPQGFECKRCGHLLDWLEKADQAPAGNEVQSRLNEQLSAFEDLMRQIDSTPVPENDFETALANMRPVQRDSTLNPAAKAETVSSIRAQPATVKGLKTEPEKIQISLDDDTQAAKTLAASEADRKAKLAAQNALPAWYTTSTVSGEQTPLGAKEEAARRERELNGVVSKTEEEEDTKIAATEDNSAVNSYYAALREEQERERKEDQEEDEEDDNDEDNDDFEDVGIVDGEAPVQKRVKIQEPNEEPPVSLSVNGPTAVDTAAGGDSDEDEFEDVV